MDLSLDRFVDFLARNKIRATYGAVAAAIGVPQQSLGELLGAKTRRASWVVNAQSGEPTGYLPDQKDPDLKTTEEIITTGNELLFRMRREGQPTKDSRALTSP